MLSNDEDGGLQDIADAVSMIDSFTADMDFEAYRDAPKTIAAVERKLLAISEAAIGLDEGAERWCPGLPWRDIRGIGIWLRHRTERVELSVNWKTVRADLAFLKVAVLRALNSPSAGAE